LCGNVFPADTWEQVHHSLQGPVRQWAQGLQGNVPPGFGLSLGANLAKDCLVNPHKGTALKTALDQSGVQVWTANAFPFGGFHSTLVKEKAFLPDWSHPERLAYTLQVAELVASWQEPGACVSVSTCPLGYGPVTRDSNEVIRHLERLAHGLSWIKTQTGVEVVVGFEPEPDGALESVTELCSWLAASGVSTQHIGVCWDLCHGEVVGESPAEAILAIQKNQIPVAKVQISSAITWQGPPSSADFAWLEGLARDRWFHQVRQRSADGPGRQWTDLGLALEDLKATSKEVQTWVHCHIPLYKKRFGESMKATPWVSAVGTALEAGLEDFEVETYTLSTLPPETLGADSVVLAMVKEYQSAEKELGC
jgi:hypothetical protein